MNSVGVGTRSALVIRLMLRPAILGLLLVSLAWGYGRGRPSVEELCKSADWVGEVQVLGERWKGETRTEIRLLRLYKGDPGVRLIALADEGFVCDSPLNLHRGQRGILFLDWNREQGAMQPMDWGFLGTDARSHRQVARYLGPARNWQSPIELPPLPDAAHLPWSELCLDGKPIRIGGSRGSVLTWNGRVLIRPLMMKTDLEWLGKPVIRDTERVYRTSRGELIVTRGSIRIEK